jgi:zinc protease
VLIDPDSVSRHVLPNGLTLLLRVERSAPVAAVVTYVKAGYFDETDDVVGIAHVLEHMYFKGTPSTSRALPPAPSGKSREKPKRAAGT